MKKSLKSLIIIFTVLTLLAVPAMAESYAVKDGAVKAGPHDVEFEPKQDLVYNGKAQALFETAEVQDGQIWYLVSQKNLWKELPLKDFGEAKEGSELERWTTEEPTATAAGDYYVLVYIESAVEGGRDSGSRELPMACFCVTIAAK